jgi:hypothetical protein
MSNYIVPDYLIYDELKRERERRVQEDRPSLEVPRYIPHLPEMDFDAPHESPEPESERGEVIIPMW